MADHHQLVDQIRAFVQASDQTRNAALESLASAYTEACVDVNQRMSRCHRLLQQGLRSEAIQLADSEPKLLDSLAALDFPERADWDDLVQIYELAVAPKLSVEQAQFLNEAYAQEDPLQDLLRSHRRLALQRAPIKSRIAVIRKLAAQDPNNAIWIDDLRIFEKARFREVQSAASLAVQTRHLGTLSQLLGEIDQQTWIEPPPKALVQALRKAYAQFRGQQTRALLTDLDARLSDAFAARDAIRGRLARQEWISATAAAPLEPTDAIWERVQPALSWLEEEDQHDEFDRAHEEALRSLIEALDEPAHIPSAELERLAHSVLQYGRGMPEGIQLRYVARLRSAEAAQTRRWRVIGAAAAAGVLLAGSLSFYFIRSWARSSDASQAASTIVDMIALDQIEDASGFLEKLEKADSGLLSYPPMIDARQKFQVIQDKETERILQFDNTIRAAEHAPLNQLNPPELDAARKIVRQQREKQAIEELVKRRADALAAERATREKDVAPRLDKLSRTIAEVQRKVESARNEKVSVAEILGPLAEAQREFAELDADLPYVGDSVQSLATVLRQKIEATQGRFDAVRRQAGLEQELTEATAFSLQRGAGNLAKFADCLDLYATTFPSDPRARAFAQTRDERPLWTAIESWNRLVEGWNDGRAGDVPRDPKIRAEECRQFLIKHPMTPEVAEIALYQKHLEAMDHRGPGADSAAAKIQRLLADILVENLWLIKIKESDTKCKCYYMASQPDESSALVRHLVGFDAKERRAPIVKSMIVISGWSPQTRIARSFKPILIEETVRSNWEKIMIDLATRIRSEPEIDPVLQVALLRGVLEQAVEGSEPLREALMATRGALEQGDVNVNVPWMDPEDADANKARPKAAHIVQVLPEFSQVLKQAYARRDQVERNIRRFPRAFGWLCHENGRWEIRSKSLPQGRADLLVAAPQEDKRGNWEKVGTIVNGDTEISGSDDAMAEGRPVFIMLHPTS
jgi:hypothetical protein